MKILIDAFGGDNSPNEVVNAVLLALFKHKDLKITLVGKKDVLQDLLAGKTYDYARLDFIDAREIIDCDEAPVEAIRTKKDSSIVKGIEELKAKPDEYGAFLSAGSTGAILSGAVLKLGRAKGIVRPALAPILPTAKGTPVLLLDAGANMDTKPVNLVQFAMLGHIYMNKVLGVQRPRVALLNVGTEDIKGNELCKETFPLLKQLPINFVGNMEARDIMSGNYDVIVADGFAGNIALKSTEGACKTLLKELKTAMLSSLSGKIGALFMKKSLKGLVKKFDYEMFGGSVLLGTKNVVIKVHGSSKQKGFLSAIEQAQVVANSNLCKIVEEEILKIDFEHLQNKAVIDEEIKQSKPNDGAQND